MKKRTLVATLLLASMLGNTALAQTLTIDTTPGMTAADLVTMIGTASNTNIVPGPSLGTIHVSLHLGNVSPETALKVLENAYGLTDYFSNGIRIVVTRADIISAPGSQTINLQTPPGFGSIVAIMASKSLPMISVSALDANSVVATGDAAGLDMLREMVTNLAKDQGEETVELRYTAPDKMIDMLKSRGMLGTTTFCSDNPNDESLTCTGPESALKSLIAESKILDRQPRRAEFDVQVLETQPLQDATNRGIVWGQPSSTSSSGSTSTSSGSSTSGSTVSVLPGITTWVKGVVPIAAQINQLASSGNAKVLAHPRLAFNSNQPGTFNFTENYPIITSYSGITSGSSVQYYPIGIILNIKALIGKDNQMTVTAQVTDSDITSYVQPGNVPVVATRGATSTVTIYPNESIVLSGFYNDTQTDTVSGIPFLMNIPIIGQLFKDRQTTHNRTELTFVITPRVVKNQDFEPELQGDKVQ